MSYGEYPDVSGETYRPERRFGVGTEELLDAYRSADHPGWKTEFAYSLLELAYEEAFETGDDQVARALHEEVAKPHVRFCFGTRDEQPEAGIDALEDELASIDGENATYSGEARLVREFASPRQEPYSFPDYHHPYQAFIDDLEAAVAPEDYDTVVGVWSSGLPLADLAADWIDPDHELVIRYSPSRGDDEVLPAPSTQDYCDNLEEASILLVDDVAQTGESVRNVIDWLQEQNTQHIDVALMRSMDSSPFSEKPVLTEV
ncbi:MAG: phosphoribosyltransferase [Candidatus Nanohaloarchaea archaeon]|nr:phosphoribosyltransferase [Candidatus Nanohaloarchaea archaeon]